MKIQKKNWGGGVQGGGVGSGEGVEGWGGGVRVDVQRIEVFGKIHTKKIGGGGQVGGVGLVGGLVGGGGRGGCERNVGGRG